MFMETFVIIDGNAIIHRAYHAFPKDLKSPVTGELTNAIYGFTRILLNVLQELKPRYVACTFDLQAPTFRHIEYKEYKAKRVKADQEMYDQIPRIKEVVKSLNIPILEAKGFEADDAIATAVAWLRNRKSEIGNQKSDIRTIIVTGDKDTLQLVDEKTMVYTPRTGYATAMFYTPEKVKARFGLEPKQMNDFKALAGDSSDNIPGAPGIGEKTATNLLKVYGTLEKLYDSLNEIQSKNMREKLEKGKESVFFSKKMVILSEKTPIKFTLKQCLLHDYDRDKADKLFMELGFKSLLASRMPMQENQKLNSKKQNDKEKIKNPQPSLF